MSDWDSTAADVRLKALVAMGNADGQGWIIGDNVDPHTAEYMYGAMFDAALGETFIDRDRVGLALKHLASATMLNVNRDQGAGIWDASCFIVERYDEGLPGSCHCGGGVVGDRDTHGPAAESLCEHCLPFRCDCYPGKCGR